MANFRQKPWTNAFGKMSIFRLFDVLVFVAQKGIFSFQTIIEDNLRAYISGNYKMGKCSTFDQNHDDDDDDDDDDDFYLCVDVFS